MIDKVIAHIEGNHQSYLDQLSEFLQIPSVSTDPQARSAMKQAATWVQKVLTTCGIEARIVETKRHPAVLADTGPVDGGGPTITVYGHYDVQPTGDLSLWDSGPFEPEIRDGRIYARGSADDKGQLLTHLLAAEAWKEVAGRLPIRIKFLIEGEEEIGSPNLVQLIEDHADFLACDYVCISDTAKFNESTPAITYGTKGMVYKEVVYTGAANDLHSGSFGGTIPNPGNALVTLLAKMKDADNRITIEGFYDDVEEADAQERTALSALDFNDDDYQRSIAAKALDGEKGYSTLERRWLRPTLDVNGLLCGFTGEGSMTVLPARSMAKVSMRLVPNQDPQKISESFDRFVKKNTPAGLSYEIKNFTSASPYVCPLANPGIQKATAAVEAGFGVAPALIREGGSLPILPMFKKILGAESLMMGFCLPTCNAHGPNEFLVVDDFMCGIKTAAYLPQLMADK